MGICRPRRHDHALLDGQDHHHRAGRVRRQRHGGKRGDYAGRTVDVGSYPPNPFGLFDTQGNVWEWVEDCWNKTHAGAPADGSARGGDCTRRVLKGGAWYFEAEYLRAAARLTIRRTSASTSPASGWRGPLN